jgi:hypothetical protein
MGSGGSRLPLLPGKLAHALRSGGGDEFEMGKACVSLQEGVQVGSPQPAQRTLELVTADRRAARQTSVQRAVRLQPFSHQIDERANLG